MNERCCKICGKIIHNDSGYCQTHYAELLRYEEFEQWKAGLVIPINIRRRFKDLLLKHQDYKCKICGIKNEWNGKELTFILDHADGDASNDKFENMRLICPNCNIQLPTYGSKNKLSKRRKYPYTRKYEIELLKKLSKDETN